ncbi:MAG: peroxide stress protein YaaA [Bacteroidales bacterium]|nr:peroxide stress protein YaaA [Bacteroidales bacterium]
MIVLLSPAKALNFRPQQITSQYTLPDNLDVSEKLIAKLRKCSSKKIGELMDLSDKLVSLNAERYLAWHKDFTLANAKQAVLAFNGDVYTGLKANGFNEGQLEFAQRHLRILSGLHGLLRPLDLIMPYRLEMGTKIGIGKANTLYQVWQKKVTKTIDDLLQQESARILVNLASAEYFKVVDIKKIKARTITPIFKDEKNGAYKIIFLYAKQARGSMARFIVNNHITEPEQLKAFDYEGYHYSEAMSTENEWVFIR